MPTPIVPYKIYNKIIGITNIKEEEELEVVKSIIMEIPPLNRKIMLYLINFIRLEIVPN